MSVSRAEALALDAAAREHAQREFESPVWLEAGAGTGKTTVLVARVVVWCLGRGWERAASRLGESEPGAAQDPQRVAADVLRRVVAITFTEAAAAEMAVRVGQVLRAIQSQGEGARGVVADVLPPAAVCGERAGALIGALDQLAVRTIHAWCRRLLADHAIEAGLHPHFEVDADEAGLLAVAREVLEDYLQRAYGDPPESDALALAADGFGPAQIEEALLVLLRGGVAPEQLRGDPLEAGRIRAFRAALERALAGFCELEAGRLGGLSRAKAVARTAERIGHSLAAVRSGLEDDAQGLALLLETLTEIWENDNDWKRLGKWSREDFEAGAPALGDDTARLARAAVEVRARLAHARSIDPARLARIHRVMLPLLEDAHRELRRRGFEGFAALLHDARDLLVGSPRAAAAVRREIEQLLVDEFQDTDGVQCSLLRVLALEGPPTERPGLFLVGDPKQSIYGWRNADLRAYHGFLGEVRAALGDESWLPRALVVNFRSAPAILDEVTRAVKPVMTEKAGVQPAFQELFACDAKAAEPGYRRDPAPAGSPGPGAAPVEHWVSWCWNEQEEAPDPRTRAGDAARLEAGALARDLRRLHQEDGVPWNHFGLLFRTTGDLDVYLSALRESGIPYVVERDKSYYERREIIDASALVRAILDPHDQLALVTTLRSALVGVPDAALLPLWRAGFPAHVARLAGPEASLLEPAAQAVHEAAAAVPDDVPGIDRVEGWPRALLAFLPVVAQLRVAWNTLAPDDFVEQLRTLTLLEAGEAARSLAPYRLANLDRFFRDLSSALGGCGGDVSGVLSALRAAVSDAREQEEGRPRAAADDAVQVMTVHKAKGLDFEHVYFVQMHKESRGPVSEPNRVVRSGPRTALQLLGQPDLDLVDLAQDVSEVEAAELVRTLYVAMTRARSRLVLMGRRGSASRRSQGAPPSHARLLSHLEPGDLEASMHEARAERATHRDLDGVRWRFPGLEGAAATASPGDAPQVVEPAAETLRADSRLLERRRAAAAAREQRPISSTATQGHDVPSETRSLALYGSAAERPGEDDAGPDPGALSGEALSVEALRQEAMDVGTAFHAALETLVFEGDDQEIRAALERDVAFWLPPGSRSAALARARSLIDVFVAGPLLARLRELGPHVVARELPVLLEPDADSQPGGEAPPDEGAMPPPVGFVSGAVDLLYRDPGSGAWVVADYKSDAVSDEEALAERAASYRGQGHVYVRGVQRALALPEPPRFELWFLHAGRVIPLPDLS